jgi:hypothetical protein
MAVFSSVEMSGLKDRIKARKEAKAGGNNDSFAEKMLLKKFGDAFKKVTPAQKKQLITLFFSPIPPVTKRLLMARIIKKGAFSKENAKTALKTVGRFATGGASLVAEKIAKRVKARKAAQNSVVSEGEKQFDDTEREDFDSERETMLETSAPTQPASSGFAKGRRGGSASKISTPVTKNISTTGKAKINSQLPMKQGKFDIKQYIVPAVIAGAVLFFVTKKTGKK